MWTSSCGRWELAKGSQRTAELVDVVLLWQVALGAGLARSLGDELVDVVLLWQVALGAGLADELVDVVVQGQVALGARGQLAPVAPVPKSPFCVILI